MVSEVYYRFIFYFTVENVPKSAEIVEGIDVWEKKTLCFCYESEIQFSIAFSSSIL